MDELKQASSTLLLSGLMTGSLYWWLNQKRPSNKVSATTDHFFKKGFIYGGCRGLVNFGIKKSTEVILNKLDPDENSKRLRTSIIIQAIFLSVLGSFLVGNVFKYHPQTFALRRQVYSGFIIDSLAIFSSSTIFNGHHLPLPSPSPPLNHYEEMMLRRNETKKNLLEASQNSNFEEFKNVFLQNENCIHAEFLVGIYEELIRFVPPQFLQNVENFLNEKKWHEDYEESYLQQMLEKVKTPLVLEKLLQSGYISQKTINESLRNQ